MGHGEHQESRDGHVHDGLPCPGPGQCPKGVRQRGRGQQHSVELQTTAWGGCRNPLNFRCLHRVMGDSRLRGRARPAGPEARHVPVHIRLPRGTELGRTDSLTKKNTLMANKEITLEETLKLAKEIYKKKRLDTNLIA